MSQLLSPEEIDALLEGVASGEVETDAGRFAPEGVLDYDLTVHERITRDGSPALGLINQLFARELQKGLRRLLHDKVQVVAESTRMSKYSEYLETLEFPTNLNLVNMANFGGQGLFVLSFDLIQNYVDYYFGGGDRSHSLETARDFTATELGVAGRVLSGVFRDYSKAWETVAMLDLDVSRIESNPKFGAFFSPTDAMVVSNFVVSFDDDSSGWLDVVIPGGLLEPIRELLDATDRGNQEHQQAIWSEELRTGLQETVFEVSTTLTRTQISLGSLVRLQPGDIIPIDLPPSIQLCANSAPIFDGTYGVANGRHAFQVTKKLSGSNNLEVQ